MTPRPVQVEIDEEAALEQARETGAGGHDEILLEPRNLATEEPNVESGPSRPTLTYQGAR